MKSVEMVKILGYGEDAFTLWALKQHIPDILKRFRDGTAPSDCLIFYRPSFGRHRKESGAVFGEFDAIMVSSKNIYLIESKWDNLSEFNQDEVILREEQKLRHQIFSWYLTHWDKRYSDDWESFVKEQQHNFKFKGKTIAPKGSLLATNLEFILTKSIEHCKNFSSDNIKNLLLFFYNSQKSKPPTKINKPFILIPIDYSKEIKGNFITLEERRQKC
jgi:hypothetical protein